MRPLLLILAMLPGLAQAWGRQGHITVALIAQHFLTPDAKAMIEDLRHSPGWQTLKPGDSRYYKKADRELIRFCQGPDLDLSLASVWADEWRFRHRQTGSFHFINIPLSSDGGVAAQRAVCPDGACVPEKLIEYTSILGDTTKPKLERLEALLWVVHLTGDIFQPLHVSDNFDRGGNGVSVTVYNRRQSLHQAWDSGFFYAEHARPSELAEQIPYWDASHEQIDPTAWASESFQVAKTFVYPQAEACQYHFGHKEIAAAWGVIQGQLAKAGARLALILNSAASRP